MSNSSVRSKTRVLTFCAVCVAVAWILSRLELFTMPQGGAVTACSRLFIVLAGFWFGPAAGCMSGAALGLLKLILGGYVVHPVQLLLDYPLAFGALGLAGFFRNMKFGLHIGYAAGVAGLFLMSFLSGVIFFASYAEGQHPALYSAIYNFSYIWPEALFTLLFISVPAVKKALDHIKVMGAGA